MFDWRREAISSDPEYYHWTEWFFAQFYKHGLAYRKMALVDWCPHCNTTLAREQVWGEDRHCERCGTPVIKKNLEQWFFRTTEYAEELLDFSHIDWPERVRLLQTNWIGRSEGAEVHFRVDEASLPADGQGISAEEARLTVFTTRPDTLWGATFMVLAPEHPLVLKITAPEQKAGVDAYVREAMRQSDIQREAADKEKTGVFTGAYAINPVNGERIPIWIADYVLMTYGTGAIMAVPAHDERDFEFALKFGLPILPVIERPDGLTKSFARAGSMGTGFTQALAKEGIPFHEAAEGVYITIPPEKVDTYIDLAQETLQPGWWNEVVGTRWVFIFKDGVQPWDSVESEERILARCKQLEPGVNEARTIMEMLWGCEFYRDALYHHEYGVMINSGAFSGTPGDIAVQKVSEWLEQEGIGAASVSYRLRDWLISRQRYWGAPIPIVYCPEHGAVPVPDEDLPVLLPDDVAWRPTGESPLKLHPTWKQTTCPVCGEPAERETDTMDTFMCSSWYHLRYLSPHYDQGPFDPEEYDYWMPVDTYTGGIEHATMHLIYTRFFHKACRDIGISKGPEPMKQLRNQGIILGEDAEKMSKSRGNVISPDDLVQQYGADTVRAYLMFFARWDMGAPWNSSGIEGTARWIRRVWTLITDTAGQGGQASQAGQASQPGQTGQPDPKVLRTLRRKVHQTLRQVTHDFENFEFNTVVSALMELLNEMYKANDRGAAGSREWEEAVDITLRMMAPVSPHVAEELWTEKLGKGYSVHTQPWPAYEAEAAREEEITLVVQVNGKVRDRIRVPADIDEEEAKETALASQAVRRFIDGKAPKKVILVPGKLVNIVI
jgi:leucyl-tRNA synthetase